MLLVGWKLVEAKMTPGSRERLCFWIEVYVYGFWIEEKWRVDYDD